MHNTAKKAVSILKQVQFQDNHSYKIENLTVQSMMIRTGAYVSKKPYYVEVPRVFNSSSVHFMAHEIAHMLKESNPRECHGVYTDLEEAKKDWKKELRKVVGHSISPEDKRSAYAHKNILVTQDRVARTDKDKYDNMDYMMAWVDSSGSMTDDQLRQCLTEVYSVALAKKPIKLIVIQCDTKIQDIKEYTDLRQLKKDMVHATVKGRGGTELKPCWDLLVSDPKYKRRPAELVMIFTDGGLNQYKRNPRTMRNLCWVILDNPAWNIQYKDINTKMVHIKTADIK
jgi:predicted metal-dependent peptidase